MGKSSTFLIFPQISITFSYFSSNVPYFRPYFGAPGGRLAHPGRPWLRHCFFDYVICEHGWPNTLLSDRGTNFLSKVVLEVCRIMRTQKLNTSSYHPECNAIQERYNAEILDTISHYVN